MVSRRRRFGSAGLLAMVATLILAPQAAEASSVVIEQDPQAATPLFNLRIEGSDDRDDIQIGIAPDFPLYYRITDSRPIINIPPNCIRESPTSIRCPRAAVTGIIRVNLNGGTDSFKPTPGTTIGNTIYVDGGAGNDLIEGRNEPGAEGDQLVGGADDDTVLGGTAEEDVVSGGDGNDYVEGGPPGGPGGATSAKAVTGGKGNDIVNGTNVTTRAASGGVNDKLSGGPGNDTLMGGSGNDKMNGGSGRDRLNGGAGNDRMFGGPGVDLFLGGPGRDFARGGGGNDRGSGGGGNDNFKD